MKRPKFPQKITVGAVSVSIYREGKGRYTTYRITWKQGGEKRREGCNDPHSAIQRAGEIAKNIADGRSEMTEVTALQKEINADLHKRLREANIPLTLSQVVDRFIEKWEPEVTEELVSEAYIKFTEAKSLFSERYKADIKHRLGDFSKKFGKRMLSSLKQDEIISFIEKKATHPRTRRNLFGLIGIFLTFCKAKKYLPQKSPHVLNGFEAKAQWPDKGQPVDKIMGSKDLECLIQYVLKNDFAEENLLTVGLLAFGGVRVEEFKRLTWNDLKFDGDIPQTIEIGRNKSKTGTRRAIPINDSLKEILRYVPRKTEGPLTHFEQPQRVIHKMAVKLKIKWPNNCLRHSYITHMMGLLQDAGRVAYLAGNSPAMIHHNYLGLSNSTEAKAWFNAVHALKLMSDAKAKLAKIEEINFASDTEEGDSKSDVLRHLEKMTAEPFN